MKQIIRFLFVLFPLFSFAQLKGNSTLDYPELIETYKKLAAEHKEIELYAMGPSDYGLPIYVCIVNGAGDSLQTFEKARSGTTLMINNAIHPGEPDGVNACLIWLNEWIEKGKDRSVPLIGIIPAYNVGGMMNRSGTSRANQDGPEEYGFRGNAQNLDLNRDFIKMDSKNMYTFATIYHALDPDVFIDTHVSNGADYQYTMTYIASVRERMAPSLGDLMHDKMIPYLKEKSSDKGFDLIPYVHTHKGTPDTGIEVFNDLPRYAMGYASLMNAISFTTETHMLKPFPQRVEATYLFLCSAINWMEDNSEAIQKARSEAMEWEQEMDFYRYNYQLQSDSTEILFKGYAYSNPVSEVTGLKRLKYHRDRPYEKMVPYFNTYKATDSLKVPDYFIIGGQCSDVLERLRANNVAFEVLTGDEMLESRYFRVEHFKNREKPYEGHYLHGEVEWTFGEAHELKPGDILVNTQQKNRRFILSVLVPDSPDSYFSWNYFDSYVQQKEYFSSYVFEDKAKEILDNDPHLKKEFEIKKSTDTDFRDSSWAQLYFIYKNSPYYEPTHNLLPVGVIYND